MQVLKVKAKDNHGYVYDVVVFEANGVTPATLRILATPGRWHIPALRDHVLHHVLPNIISLDFGQNWDCINFDEIVDELRYLGFNL